MTSTVDRRNALSGARKAPSRIGRTQLAHSVSASRAEPAVTAIGAPQLAHGLVVAASFREEVNAYMSLSPASFEKWVDDGYSILPCLLHWPIVQC